MHLLSTATGRLCLRSTNCHEPAAQMPVQVLSTSSESLCNLNCPLQASSVHLTVLTVSGADQLEAASIGNASFARSFQLVQRMCASVCELQQKDRASGSQATSRSCVMGHVCQHGLVATDTSASWLTTSLHGQSSRGPATGVGSNWCPNRLVVATPLQKVGHCIRQRICLVAMVRRSTSALHTSQPAVCMLAWLTTRQACYSLWNLAAHMVRIVARRRRQLVAVCPPVNTAVKLCCT